MKSSREHLLRDLRHRFSALLIVSLISWMTMVGMLVFFWWDGLNLKVRGVSWLVLGLLVSAAQLTLLITVAVKLCSTMEARSSLMSTLEYASEHDCLTGLVNRRGFEFSLSNAIYVAARQKKSLSLLYLDLDGFKLVNDLYGHAVGDILLGAVATSWRESTRDGDILARLGGDEFVMLTHATGSDVEALCQRLLSVATVKIMKDFPELRIGVSIGAAEFPRDAKDGSSLIRAADSAMLSAKSLGRSCFTWATKRAG